jgi:hypothetical protein
MFLHHFTRIPVFSALSSYLNKPKVTMIFEITSAAALLVVKVGFLFTGIFMKYAITECSEEA